MEKELSDMQKRVNEKMGVKESDTGLAPPNLWDINADKQRMHEEQSLQVARCTKIIQAGGEGDVSKYVINIKQIAKFVVGLGERVAPTDIEEGMRVGVDRHKYQIQIPLPPKIDASVTMMQVEEKPDVTYGDVGGCKEQIEKLREVVELPLLQVCLLFSLIFLLLFCLNYIFLPAENRSLKNMSILESTRPKACFYTDPLVLICCGILDTSRYWKNFECKSGCQPNRCNLYPSHWLRACAKVCWRGCANGARAL